MTHTFFIFLIPLVWNQRSYAKKISLSKHTKPQNFQWSDSCEQKRILFPFSRDTNDEIIIKKTHILVSAPSPTPCRMDQLLIFFLTGIWLESIKKKNKFSKLYYNDNVLCYSTMTHNRTKYSSIAIFVQSPFNYRSINWMTLAFFAILIHFPRICFRNPVMTPTKN